MADVVLTHSYMVESDPKQLRIGQPYPPLGTLYAASVLLQAGKDICFYDITFAKNPDTILTVLQKEKPSILIIYDDEFSFISKMCLASMRSSAFRMIQLGKDMGCKIIVYSADAMCDYSVYLNQGADFVIFGEGEITLKELVCQLLEGVNTFEVINGIFWNKNGQIIKNKPRELLSDPDILPFPAWHLVDIDLYRTVWKKKNGFFTLNMVTTRGCPYHCVWCSKPVYGNHFNSRSPENVINEMQFLKENYFPDRIWFADDIFGLKPGWIEEFGRRVAERKLNIPFIIQARVDLLAEEDRINSLASSGCSKVWLGIESGSQKILNGMQKGLTLAQIYSVSPLIRHSGIEQAFFLQLGFPGENRDDIRKTVKLLTDLLPDDIGISVTYPLPGTKFYDSVSSQIETKTNWKDSDDISPLVKSNFPAAYYKPLHRYIHKHYRFKQALFYLKSSLTGSKTDLKQLRRIVLMPYYLVFSLFYKMILMRYE